MNKKHPSKFFQNFFRYYLAGFAVLVAFTAGVLVGNQQKVEVVNPVQGGQVVGVGEVPDYLVKDADFDLFWDAWKIVKDNYVDQPVNETKLLYGAIAGMVASLDDPHSVFFDPETNQAFLQELNGSFFGIGAEISIKNNQLQVVAPLPNTPAERAGIRARDFILAIDGVDTSGMALDEAVKRIRGEKGTEVVLTILHQGDQEPVDISIIRDQIHIESVTWEMLDGKIAYVKLRYFNSDTDNDFRRIAKQIVAQNAQGVILDMRNDPGGFLEVAIRIASEFVEDGVIVSERKFDGTVTEHQAQGRARLADLPVVVLLNEGSASASEIVAGALQDYGIAKIVGKQSFGKGSVQTIFNLDDGSAIKLTIAKWLTPSGHTIEGQGITPDYEVDLTTDDFNNDRDPQLDKAVELLTSFEKSE